MHVILLNRFDHTGSKIENIIRQNLKIKVGEKSFFNFLGSINHISKSSHYVAILKIRNKFVRFDDAQVRLYEVFQPLSFFLRPFCDLPFFQTLQIKVSSISELTKEQSYVLFYVRQLSQLLKFLNRFLYLALCNARIFYIAFIF